MQVCAIILFLYYSPGGCFSMPRCKRQDRLQSAPRHTDIVVMRQSADPTLKGSPISPVIPGAQSDVLIRYFYDGGTLSQGRICTFTPARRDAATGFELLRALHDDGVDLHRFYPCVYETEASSGGWLPLLQDVQNVPPPEAEPVKEDVSLPLATVTSSAAEASAGKAAGAPCSARQRVDVKLFRRGVDTHAAALAEAEAQPCGKLPRSGYHAIGVGTRCVPQTATAHDQRFIAACASAGRPVARSTPVRASRLTLPLPSVHSCLSPDIGISPRTVNVKQHANTGTLWRSAYQLGASFVFTVGARYRSQPTDTIHATSRMPLYDLNDWSAFVEFAPRGAMWVAVEMGGTPLEDFVHPHCAIYLLGSEDAGLPKAVLSACQHVVSLGSERYASYNVATAGAIVMYDRKSKGADSRSGPLWPQLQHESQSSEREAGAL